ncbi:MAG TPA: TIGR03435 family protein, partial [Bryobacteraceae bacterium]|nr:TIGR03435 family protein [Bryobacteraceae bacterium]
PPSFEVASIKPSNPTRGRVGPSTYPGGRVFVGHATLKDLVADAFDVQDFQVKGGAGWMRADQYDVDARPPASSESAKTRPAIKAPLNPEQREMLLSLLADRFHFRFHREEVEGPVLLLTKGKAPKLDPPADAKAYSWVGSATEGGMMTGTGIRGTNASMALLADRLQWYFERPVIDRTGIQGSFDFKFQTPWDGPPITSSKSIRSPEVLTNIVSAIQGIGLKLENGKDQIETIVIDDASRPTPN